MDRQWRALKWVFVSLCVLYILLEILPSTEESDAGKITSREFLQQGSDHRHHHHHHLHNANTMRLKMFHRNAHNSPFRNPGKTRLESLMILLRHDKARLAAFSASIDNTISAPDYPAEAPVYDNGGSVPRSLSASIFSGAYVGSGQYFVDLEIGTPPHRVLLIADTGSDLVWVKCRYHARKHFRSRTRVFNADISSTFAPVSCAAEECQLVPPPPLAPCSARHPTSCKYMYTYSDQSETSGIFAYETVTIHASATNTTRIPNVAIGCGTENQGQSFQGADGVIGLGQGPISFISQLGNAYSQKFSYCLVDHLNPPASSSNFLVFGNRNVPKLRYTALLKNPPLAPETYYYLSVRSVSINRKLLPVPPSTWAVDPNGNRGTIIDSGTTLSYLLEPAHQILLATFEKLVSVSYPRIELEPFDLCINSSGISHIQIPEFSIEFDGGEVFHPPVENYFIDAADDVKCLGILGSSSPSGFNVIGNIMQQNFVVEFDRRKSRLGFARTDCSRLK